VTQWIKTSVATSTPFDNETNGFIADNVQDAIEEVREGGGSARYPILFSYNGSAGPGKELELFQAVSSFDSPFVVAEVGTVKSMSFSNINVDNFEIAFYKNGTLVDTLVVSSSDTGYEAGLSWAVAAGDKISAKMISGSARNPVYVVSIKTSA
jgi:hypothetical protein